MDLFTIAPVFKEDVFICCTASNIIEEELRLEAPSKHMVWSSYLHLLATTNFPHTVYRERQQQLNSFYNVYKGVFFYFDCLKPQIKVDFMGAQPYICKITVRLQEQ